LTLALEKYSSDSFNPSPLPKWERSDLPPNQWTQTKGE
jgi:hypothetical protein